MADEPWGSGINVDCRRQRRGTDVRTLLSISGTRFIDSGARVLVDAYIATCDTGGSLRVDAMSAPVKRVFDVLGITAMLGSGTRPSPARYRPREP